MKLLLFSDVHHSKTHCERLVKKSKEVDIVIGAGDFSLPHSGLEETIEWLKAIKKPFLAVPGNAENDTELKNACRDWENAIVLHGSSVYVEKIYFFGIGGAIPVTPFGSWSFDLTEDEAVQLLGPAEKVDVLISHSPPKGIVDLSSRREHLGSTAILSFIEQNKPRLVVCGHIHESAGQTIRVGDTDVVNAGPEGVLYEL